MFHPLPEANFRSRPRSRSCLIVSATELNCRTSAANARTSSRPRKVSRGLCFQRTWTRCRRLSRRAKVANEHPLAAVCEYLINGEPTDNRLATGTKGSLQASITAAGRAAHSAYPEQGESAIEKLLDVLADIRKVKWPSDNVFGDTTCNIGLVSGGTRANIIPSEAVATLQLRLAVDAATVKDRLEEAIAGRAALDYKSVHDPVRLSTIDGFDQMLARFTTDIPYLHKWGKPLLIGPGSILDAHTDHEKVKKSELLRAVDLYVDLVKKL